MKENKFEFQYDVYNDLSELTEQDAWLLTEARAVTEQAYAPYSKISTGLWFNDCMPVAENITQSNYAELANLSIPVWGHQLYQSQTLRFFDFLAKSPLGLAIAAKNGREIPAISRCEVLAPRRRGPRRRRRQ